MRMTPIVFAVAWALAGCGPIASETPSPQPQPASAPPHYDYAALDAAVGQQLDGYAVVHTWQGQLGAASAVTIPLTVEVGDCLAMVLKILPGGEMAHDINFVAFEWVQLGEKFSAGPGMLGPGGGLSKVECWRKPGNVDFHLDAYREGRPLGQGPYTLTLYKKRTDLHLDPVEEERKDAERAREIMCNECRNPYLSCKLEGKPGCRDKFDDCLTRLKIPVDSCRIPVGAPYN